MIRLVFAERPSVRFAFSPIWEVLASARALRGGDRIVFPPERIREAESILSGRDMAPLWAVVDPRSGYLPGFLAPAPKRPFQDLEDDLSAIRSTSPDRVRQELALAAEHAKVSAGRLREWAHRPSEFLGAVSEAIRGYWEGILEPDWARHNQVLEGEVVARGRELALHGAEKVLDALGPGVSWEGGCVRVDCGTLDTVETVQDDLILVPSVSTWPKVFVGASDATLDVVYYPARGAARLLLESDTSAGTLSDLIGETRAAIALNLSESATTTELADRLALAPSTVSEHLGRLTAAGLATRNRIGRRVYYQLSPRGVELVLLFRGRPLYHNCEKTK